MTYLLFLIGFIFLIKGAGLLVDGASSLAKKLRVSNLVIGLTIMAFGTSAPELFVNLFAAFKGTTDIAIGNIIGSNSANILLILGISALIFPLKVSKSTVWKEIPMSLLAVVLVLIMVNAVLVGADTFVEIELWAREKLDWLRGHLKLEAGMPLHATFGRRFGLIDPDEFEAAFRRWVGTILPSLGVDAVVAIDGKTSRRSGKVDATPLHLVSAFAAGADLVLGQRATAAKSNEKTAIPELLATLAREGCTSPLTRWVLRPASPEPSDIVARTTSWPSRTISRPWPMPCGISIRCSRPPRSGHPIRQWKPWRRIMVAWKPGAATLSIN
jgi:hypothetical protein